MIPAMRSTTARLAPNLLIVLLFSCCFDSRYPLERSYKTAVATATSTTAFDSCNLYLAPSTIPGAGLGIFAGRDGFAYGDPVSYGDVVVPLEGIKYYNGKSLNFLWDEYTWNVNMFPGMENEMDDDSKVKMNGASPGFGALCF